MLLGVITGQGRDCQMEAAFGPQVSAGSPRNNLAGLGWLRMALVLLLTLLLTGCLAVPLVNGTPVEPTLKQYLALMSVGGDCVSLLES